MPEMRLLKLPFMNIAVSIIAIAIFLVLIDRLLYLDFTGMSWRSAKRALPEFARQHSLTFEAAFQRHQMGSVCGLFQGRAIRIDPDHLAVVKIEVPRVATIRLASFAPQSNQPDGLTPFETGNTNVDRYFKTRLAPGPLQIDAQARSRRFNKIEIFTQHWKSKLRYVKLANGELTFSFKYGQATYIPGKILEEFLPGAVHMAVSLETIFANHGR
jgi:hypothetical protein